MKKRSDCFVLIVLRSTDNASNDRSTVEPQPTVPNGPFTNKPIEPDIEIPLRRSQRIRIPSLLDDYVSLHENDFNIRQSTQIL